MTHTTYDEKSKSSNPVMKQHRSIHEIAKLFNVSVPTLHFWESKGLFHISKNDENQYREFTFSDILNIWEIVLYRRLGIPIRDIHALLNQNLNGLESIYHTNETRLLDERRKIDENLKQLRRQQSLLDTIKDLEAHPLRLEDPDFLFCEKDPFEIDTIQMSLENPYRCCLHIDLTTDSYQRGIQIVPTTEAVPLWQFANTHKGTYFSFLLKVNIEDFHDHNLQDIIHTLQKQGYTSDEVIARYLLVATDPAGSNTANTNTPSKRYEYYKAWIHAIS